MAKREDLILGSDNLIELCNLRDTTDDSLQTGATVTARVLDDTGTPVSGVPDPITLNEVAGRSGLYRGTIPAAASVSLGDRIKIVVTAVSTGGVTRVFTILAVVEEAA